MFGVLVTQRTGPAGPDDGVPTATSTGAVRWVAKTSKHDVLRRASQGVLQAEERQPRCSLVQGSLFYRAIQLLFWLPLAALSFKRFV